VRELGQVGAPDERVGRVEQRLGPNRCERGVEHDIPLAWALRRARVPMVMLAASGCNRIMRIGEARPTQWNES
jgi:hypothetical protein